MINIVILATNSYAPLGVRLIKNINHFYVGDIPIHIHIFSDSNIYNFINCDNVTWHPSSHSTWADATNSKFKNIDYLIKYSKLDKESYIYYLDADTDIIEHFSEIDIIGDLVAVQHFHFYLWKDGSEMPFDRNPKSTSYISKESCLPARYHQGAFFGGKIEYVEMFCEILMEWQKKDKQLDPPYEPGVNDESYINKFFHITPPSRSIDYDDFVFKTSCKGGLQDYRSKKGLEPEVEKFLIETKNDRISIQRGEFKAVKPPAPSKNTRMDVFRFF